MTFLAWPRDTIARRFALAVILAIVVTVSLASLFLKFGGEWARPPVQDTGLPGEAAGIIRVIDAAPPEMRQTLVAAASMSTIQIDLYDAASPVSAALTTAASLKTANDVRDARDLIGNLLDDTPRPVIVFRSDSRVSTTPSLNYDRAQYPDAYFLGAELNDGSWLLFTVLNKTWGMPRRYRMVLLLAFLALSISGVSVFAARRLSRPVKRLAEAVRLFGLNPQAPPLAETGPQELRQVIKTFNAMQAQIQKFVAYRTTMLAAISHDLRTPLTRMRLRGEFIEDKEQQARLFRDVDEMQAMVDGALAFFRDDAIEEAMTDFDLPGVLRTIANDYADQDVSISYSGPARALYRGRPFALKRAFTNLVENAIKYGTPPEIELSCEEKVFVVAVRDHGPGIPLAALDHVFTPFYRVEKSRNRTTGGVGLGLTAAQAIVRAHGGDITLDNRPDGGLEARVALPMVSDAV